MTTTLGDLTAHAIGRGHVTVQHEGSTVSGLLTALDIDTDVIHESTLGEPHRVLVVDVHVTVTIGSITLGPLDRSYPCEVIAS